MSQFILLNHSSSYLSCVASTFSSVRWRFLLDVGTYDRLTVGSVGLNQIFSYGVCTRSVCAFFGITQVWIIWVPSRLSWMPPPSAFRDTQCLELRRSLPSAFRNAWCSWDTASWPSNDSSVFPDSLNVLLLPWLVFS